MVISIFFLWSHVLFCFYLELPCRNTTDEKYSKNVNNDNQFEYSSNEKAAESRPWDNKMANNY